MQEVWERRSFEKGVEEGWRRAMDALEGYARMEGIEAVYEILEKAQDYMRYCKELEDAKRGF